MKRFIFKTILFIPFFAIISCTEYVGSTDEKTSKINQVDCDCTQIKWKDGYYKWQGELFTGTCDLKNAQDSLLSFQKYKNGYLVFKQEWKEVNRQMIQTKEMKYYDGDMFNGFLLKIDVNEYLEPSITYASEYKRLYEGKIIDHWFIRYSPGAYKSFLFNAIDNEGDCMTKGNITTSRERDEVLSFLSCIENKDLAGYLYFDN